MKATEARTADGLHSHPDIAGVITNSIGEGVCALDGEGHLTFMNPAAERILGWRQEEMLGKDFHRTVHFQREDGTPFPAAECPVLKVMQTNEVATGSDDVFTRKNGKTFPVAYTSAPIVTDGQTTGAVIAFRDVTERRRIEEQLRHSEQHLRGVLDSLFTFVGVLTPYGSLIEANRAALAAASLSPADVIGKPFEETYWWSYSRDVQRELRDAIRRATRGEASRYDVEIRVAEDKFIVIEFSLVPMFDAAGKVTHLIPSGTDITERKRAEAELRASERRYSLLADAMPQLVWATDANGAHVYYNQRWYDFTGLTEEESMGFGFANALHPDDRERTLKRWQSAWRDGEAYEIEYRFYSRPRDEYRWFLARALPVRDEEGQIVQWVGTCTDIEVQKRMEAELAAYVRERTEMVRELSTLVVPVLPGVLALPLIGALDNERMKWATEAALAEVRRTNARACIIDITGARITDSRAVAEIGDLATSLRLIGAEAIIAGVNAQTARKLVRLGVDFTGLRTHRTLAEAIKQVMSDK